MKNALRAAARFFGIKSDFDAPSPELAEFVKVLFECKPELVENNEPPKHTPGPWVMHDYCEAGGYDCMTGGLQVGPITLDGADYGQEWHEDENSVCPDAMLADAHLISAAPEMLEACKAVVQSGMHNAAYDLCVEAIAKATGKAQ